MSIAYTEKQWDEVSQTYTAWWTHQLDRPITPVWLADRDPGRPLPSVPLLSQENCADFSIPAEEVIDRIDYELSRYTFLGDAFPYVNFGSFGPGLAAAFLGARLDNSSGRVWFHPESLQPLSSLQLRYNPDNACLQRIRDLYKAGLDRWGDQVLLGMPDLGGSMDILATFRPGEHLLFDLVDEPEAVLRLNWLLHDLWHRFFTELSADLRGGIRSELTNRGWSDWSGTFCAEPAYILQCDFAYMISPDMFERFVKPELAASANRLGHTVYHLDGIGQLGHLNSILTIPDIHAIQWVPGDGKPPQHEWPEVYHKIHQAGKAKLVFCGLEGMRLLMQQLGTARGLCHMPVCLQADQAARAAQWLALAGL